MNSPTGIPAGNCSRAANFTIRGECDLRPDFNAQIGAGGGHFSYWGGEAHSIVDGNFPYKGALKIVSVPKGSTWQVSVSDIPNDRAPAPVEQISAARIMFRAPPPAPKPVSDRAAALERQMLPRQLSNSPRDATNRA